MNAPNSETAMAEEKTDKPGMKFLTPENTRIFRGTFNMLHVMVTGDTLYRGVFAVQAFPVSARMKFISLFYYDDLEKIREIGMIEDINTFPEEARALLRETLGRYYYYREILRVYAIKREFGLLFLDVETNQGPLKFTMRWEQNSAVDFGKEGKILLDVFEDRYIIMNVEKLPRIDRELFQRFIYW